MKGKVKLIFSFRSVTGCTRSGSKGETGVYVDKREGEGKGDEVGLPEGSQTVFVVLVNWSLGNGR